MVFVSGKEIKTKMRAKVKSILLVDDEGDFLDLYAELFAERTEITISKTRFPSQALKRAKSQLYDLICIDVSMNYNGSLFGGLELYNSLLERYGNSSLIAYSQVISDDVLRLYNTDFNFIEKGADLSKFADKIIQTAEALRARQSCFVAMPFAKKYNSLFQVIKKCIKRAGYRCVRVDEEHFTKSIIERILADIAEAKFIIFLASDRNPNAFYEAGYALALGKEIVTLTDHYRNLPFDIRDKTAIAYGNDFARLEKTLTNRLTSLVQA